MPVEMNTYFSETDGVNHFVGVILYDHAKKALAIASDPRGMLKTKSISVTADMDPQLGKVLDLNQYENIEIAGCVIAQSPYTRQRPTDSRSHLSTFINFIDLQRSEQTRQYDETQILGIMSGSKGGYINLYDEEMDDAGDWGLLVEDKTDGSKSAQIYFFSRDAEMSDISALIFLNQLSSKIIEAWGTQEIRAIQKQLVDFAKRGLETDLRIGIFMASVLARYLLVLDRDQESKLFINRLKNQLMPPLLRLSFGRNLIPGQIRDEINASVDLFIKDDCSQSRLKTGGKAEVLPEPSLAKAHKLKQAVTEELKGKFGEPNDNLSSDYRWQTMDIYFEKLIKLVRACAIDEIDGFIDLLKELIYSSAQNLEYRHRFFHHENDSETTFIRRIGYKPDIKEWWVNVDDIARQVINEIWQRKQQDKLVRHNERLDRF